MKKHLLFSLSFITFLLVISTNAYSVKHIINTGNYYFSPNNLNVQVGDTIRWVWVEGVHTTTSTTIPAGAAAWDAPLMSSSPSYEYRVTVAGVYNYLCTPHSSTQIAQFTATSPSPTLSVTPSNQSVGSSAGSTNFTVTSNTSWSASSNQNWCTVTSSGSGNGTLVANYQANTSTSQRVATITVQVSGLPNETVTVTQAGASPSLAVTPSNQNVTAAAGSTNFTVTSNSNWTAISDDDWCVVTPSGSGNGVIQATYGENTLPSQRVATITVSVSGLPDETVTVTQAGFSATLSVTPSNRNVTSAAGTTTFTITTNSDWTASSNSSWATVPSSGSGNATLTVAYEANEEVEPRVAVVTVSVSGVPSVQVTVNQAGAPVILLIDPLNQDVTWEAGSVTFNVIANSNWSVDTPDEWVSSTNDGSGNGTIVVDYEENTSNEVRVATLNVTSGDITQEITVTQEGTISVIDNPITGISIYPNPTSGIVEITSDGTGLQQGETLIRVVDLKGNIVTEQQVNNLSSHQMNLSALAPGTYLIRLDNAGKSKVSRIAVVK